LANATSDTDALNRQTGDSRYYLATTPLNSITAPTGNVSINDNKLTNVTAATTYKEAMTLGQDMRWQWTDVRVSTPITSLNSPHKIIFDSNTIPSLGSVSPTVYWNTDHVFLGFGGAVYLMDL
jgi:hypothetical protein